MPTQRMEKQPISEAEIVRGCLANDRKYQEALYRKYADDMYAVCLMYTPQPADAQDVLQNAFIRIFASLHQYEAKGHLRAWVRRIVVNAAIDFYKKRRREQDLWQGWEDDEQAMAQVSVDDILAKVNYQDTIRLVNALPERAQMVLKLYAIEGYKHSEIADIMGINEGTSKSQLNRAKRLLQEALQHQQRAIDERK